MMTAEPAADSAAAESAGPASDTAGTVARPVDRMGFLAALALGLVLACAVCWEAIAGGTGRVIGAADTEVWSFLWGHAWTAHAVFEEGRVPLHTTWIDFPSGGTLWLKDSLSTFALLPLQLFVGPETTYDLSVVLHLALACGAAFLWCRELGAQRLSALLCAPLYAFMPHTLGEVYNGNIEAVSTAFTPLWGWALLRVIRDPGRRSVGIAAVTLMLLMWSNQYWTLAMAVTSPLILAIGLWQAPDRRPARLLAVCLAVLGGAVLSTPFLLGLRANMVATDSLTFFDRSRIMLSEPYLTDLLHYLRPLAPLAGQPPTTLQDIAYPLWLLVLLALLAPLCRRRSPWAWLLPALGLLGIVLSVGPAASWDGHLLTWSDGSVIYLPWAFLIGQTPILDSMTLPHRIIVPTTAFLVGAAALTLDTLARRPSPAAPALAAGLAALVGIELIVAPGYRLPIRTTVLERPAHALLLAEAPGDGAVLNLPQRTGLNTARIFLWYQAIHGRATSQTLRHGGASSAGDAVPMVKAAWRWERQLARSPDVSTLPTYADPDAGRLGEVGFDYVVLHPWLLADLAQSDPHVHQQLVERWAALVLPDLAPGIQLPDSTVLITIDPSQRDAVEAMARARWGDAVRHVETPDDLGQIVAPGR